MRIYFSMGIFIFLFIVDNKQPAVKLPEWLKGNFADDYGIHYTITDSIFYMYPSAKYHILDWNEKEEFILARNDSSNKTGKGLFTRIDLMKFTGMEPYQWGYCFTVYDAKEIDSAMIVKQADRSNPKKGCNGFPFSRMKPR